MVNYIWIAMTLIGVVYALFNGTMQQVTQAFFTSASEAVTVCLGLLSALVFWLGLMRIAEEAGLLKRLARLFAPIARRIFPDVPADHPAMGYILTNLTANFFGLGNAATPMGIKAMEHLKELNGNGDKASRSMITLLSLNTAGVTLIPTSVIAIRVLYQSASPADIVFPNLVVGTLSTIAALVIDRYYQHRSGPGRGR